MEKEDNRYVTGGKKEQRRQKELLSWADWGSEGRGAKESCDLAEEGVEGFEGEICRRWREDLLAGEAQCPYGLQLLGGSLASPLPRCLLSAQARLWLALKHLSNRNHLRVGCIFSQGLWL